MPRGPLNKNPKKRFRARLTGSKDDAHLKLQHRYPADDEPPPPVDEKKLAAIKKLEKPKKIKTRQLH
ncbi:MAG: hypothetical protein WCG97_03400 [bacterium]